MNGMFEKKTVKKKKTLKNLAIKYLSAQNLFLATIFIGEEFDVMYKTLYWELRAMSRLNYLDPRLGSVVIFWVTLGKLLLFSNCQILGSKMRR